MTATAAERTIRDMYRRGWWVAAVAAALWVFGGCTVQLVGPYDEVTDRAVTDLHRKFETFFVQLDRTIGTTDGEYANYKQFYDSARIDTSALRLRVGALPQNENTTAQVDALAGMVENLETLHKEAKLDADGVRIQRELFNVGFGAILALELKKKRED